MNDLSLELEAYEPLAGTALSPSLARAHVSPPLGLDAGQAGLFAPTAESGKINIGADDRDSRSLPGPDEWTDDTTVPDPWSRDGAQSGPNASPRRADAGSGVAPSVLLTLPYPISANRYWASRTVTPRGKPAFTSTYVTPEAKAYKAQVQKLALVAGVRKPIAGRVRVEFTLYPNRPQDWQKRMRKDGAAWDDTVQCLDLDNAQKVVLDSLKDVVFQDDAWVREISARRAEPDEFGARLVAVVTPLAVEQPQTDLFGAVAQERAA
ncbi:RusA family crossover junction endodeoxyribonuclease [Achromobacter xylosoxidans]|uniref:RusA family crossover junction endodeoxyribonuclease n=1 Tax=Alcaligenes xylosoxydans xylosoxydans TaxID=85698 RepID=UPI0006C6ED17|nr:RusA family crossover junction endodeoxyribonuclease [Achromobacter xylosoxidans]CUI55557.1 Holliday junction resolvase [Achromobacter xylosoxidans]